jgi:hypothetical protein
LILHQGLEVSFLFTIADYAKNRLLQQPGSTRDGLGQTGNAPDQAMKTDK